MSELRIDEELNGAQAPRRLARSEPARRELAQHRRRALRRRVAIRAHRARGKAVRARARRRRPRAVRVGAGRGDPVRAHGRRPAGLGLQLPSFDFGFLRTDVSAYNKQGILVAAIFNRLRRRRRPRRLLDARVLSPRGRRMTPARADPRSRPARPGARPRARRSTSRRCSGTWVVFEPGTTGITRVEIDEGAGAASRRRVFGSGAGGRAPDWGTAPAQVFADDVAGDRGVGVPRRLRPRLRARRAVRLPEPRRARGRRRHQLHRRRAALRLLHPGALLPAVTGPRSRAQPGGPRRGRPGRRAGARDVRAGAPTSTTATRASPRPTSTTCSRPGCSRRRCRASTAGSASGRSAATRSGSG